MSGCIMIWTISRLSRAMISFGVPAGATTPYLYQIEGNVFVGGGQAEVDAMRFQQSFDLT
jgi:hypothetical protein